jgi:hypothetical protein
MRPISTMGLCVPGADIDHPKGMDVVTSFLMGYAEKS